MREHGSMERYRPGGEPNPTWEGWVDKSLYQDVGVIELLNERMDRLEPIRVSVNLKDGITQIGFKPEHIFIHIPYDCLDQLILLLQDAKAVLEKGPL